MWQVEIHPEVYEELEQTRAWYEKNLAGLGSGFLDEVDKAITTIRRAPEAWPFYVGDVRRFLVHRFPFAVLYRCAETKIQIFAVMHLHRKPGYWKKRKF